MFLKAASHSRRLRPLPQYARLSRHTSGVGYRRLSTASEPLSSLDYTTEATEGKFLLPKKTFGRKQMRSQYLAELMRESSIVLFATGKSLKVRDEIVRKKELKSVGLQPHRFKASNLVAAAKYYTVYSERNVQAAQSFAQGHVTVLLWRDPLLSLVNEATLKEIKAKLVMSEEKDMSSEDTRLRVKGAFLMDKDKDRPFVWLSLKEFNTMLEDCKELAKYVAMDAESLAELPPHALFQAELNKILVGNMSGVTRPLEQQLQLLPQTLQGAVQRIDQVLMQVRDKREHDNTPH